MKLIVLAAPEMTGNGTLASGTQGKSYKHTFSATGSKTITFSISGGSLPSGMSLNAKGKLSGKPTASGTFTFTVKAANSAGEDSKEFTLTIAASTSNKSAGTYSAEGVTPKNKDSVLTQNHGGAVQEYASVENEGTANFTEGEYTVVAVLPAVSVDVSGMYEFSVTLDENAETDAKLLWIAGSSEPSDDDSIAEFFDEDGKEIDAVPENRKVNVSAWLNAGRIYMPMIAVKH